MPLFGKTAPEEMIIEIILVVLIAFMPSIIYMIVLRYVEKYDREPWGSMGTVFLWGATMGVVAVILVRGIFRVHFSDYNPELATDREAVGLILAVVITPIIAEIIKPLGLLFVRHDIEEAEDGLIYGAISGLGYAATENLLYGIFLVSIYGLDFFIYVVIVRSISVVLINACSSALTGYGVSRATAVKHKVGSLWMFPFFLFAAMGIHSFFNYLLVSGVDIGDLMSASFSFVFAIGISIGLMVWIYFKIYRLDRMDEKEFEDREEEEEYYRERDLYPPRRRVPADYHGRPHPDGGPPPGYPQDDYYYQRRDYPQQQHPGMHGRPPPQPGRPPMRHPQDDFRAEPPRARRVGEVSHRPPPAAPQAAPPNYEAQPPSKAPGGRPPPAVPAQGPGRGRQHEPPRAPPRPSADEARDFEGVRAKKHRPKRPSKPPKAEPEEFEGELDWEDDMKKSEEEHIDWEEVESKPEEPEKPKKGSDKKAKKKIEWSEEDSEGEKPPEKSKSGTSKKDEEWWNDE